MTAEVIKKSQGVGKEIQEAKQQLLSGVCPINVDQVKFKFHGEFVERMQQVDEAIQELDWVTESRQAGIKSGALAAGLAAALLVGSISIALGAEIKSDTAIGDGWNVVAGGLLALLTIGVCSALVWAFYTNRLSREEWINRKIKIEAKKSKG